MSGPLFPLWQIDPDEYRAVCTYLRLTPQPRLYDHLSRYLADAPRLFPDPSGFSRYLAKARLTRFRIGRLDPMTKLFLPGHPLRHVLNGVIALHECDPLGYRELAVGSRFGAGVGALGAVLRFGVNLAFSLPWLGWQWAGFAANVPFNTEADLGGKRALITGVGRGLGRDLMLRCLESGAEVIGIVRNRASREKLQGELPAHARVTLLVADLSTPGALAAALIEAQIPPNSVAIAILSAAIKHDGKSVLSSAELRETFQVNFFAAAELADWLCGPLEIPPSPKADAPASPSPSTARAALASSSGPASQRGLSSTTRVVLISSMGRWHGMHFSAGYNASKAALSIWGESLDMELRQRSDRRFSVTVVEPGIFPSGMSRQTPLTRMLFASRDKIAGRILAGALAGRRAIRPPRWFALLTWGICLIGRDYRYRLLARAKPHAER